MAHVLAIMANPRRNSYTARLMQNFLAAYQRHHPADTVTELDVYQVPIPVIDGDVVAACDKAPTELTDKDKARLAEVGRFTDQFMAADKIVVAAPMWNLQFPPMLSAYLATVVVPGKTFQYSENGWQGLLHDRPALLLHVRGGAYSDDQGKQHDFAVPYLRDLFALMGITNFRTILCEGVEAFPDKTEDIVNQALREAEELAVTF